MRAAAVTCPWQVIPVNSIASINYNLFHLLSHVCIFQGEGLSETVDEGTAPAPQDQSAHTKAGLNFAKAAAAAAQLPDPAAALPNGKPAADLPSVNGKHSHDAEMKSEPSSSLIQEENKISSGLIEQDGPDHVNTTQSHAEPQKDEVCHVP